MLNPSRPGYNIYNKQDRDITIIKIILTLFDRKCYSRTITIRAGKLAEAVLHEYIVHMRDRSDNFQSRYSL